MYQKKDKSYGRIALIYYCIYFLGLLSAGFLLWKGVPYYGTSVIYIPLFAAGIIIALVKDGNIYNLGYGKENLKENLLISLVIVVITFLVILKFSSLPFGELFRKMLYYLFYIAAVEEILFRGLIQSYLFGIKGNKYIIFIIGALLFAFIHIPFQMFAHGNVSWGYLIEAIPNLIETFFFHLLFCWITCKRGDITIPIAIHYAYDFLGVII